VDFPNTCSYAGQMTAGDVRRPSWWSYPERCHRGHEWGPGRVIVGWMPCDCPSAITASGMGHLWVRCQEPGCSSVWYQPTHQA
jgi:hypothetical protein